MRRRAVLRLLLMIIDTCLFEPSPPGSIFHGKFIRQKTIKEFTDELIAAFLAGWPNEFEWFGLVCVLDHGHTYLSLTSDSPIPDEHWLICYVERGGSEGWLVRLDLFNKDNRRIPILSGKCFDRDYAWRACRVLHELID
jgi:hypothetical protein